jgi:hypothetical protein
VVFSSKDLRVVSWEGEGWGGDGKACEGCFHLKFTIKIIIMFLLIFSLIIIFLFNYNFFN